MVDCTFGLFSLSGPGSAGPVVITLSTHLAGGIYTLSYAGTDFVTPMAITGGSMQSDVYLGGGRYNPTEAGSQGDSMYNTGKSSSKLLDIRADSTKVYTSTRAAYWAIPGVVDPAHGKIPPYKTPLSDCVVSKLLEFIGNGVLDYTYVWTIPRQHVPLAMAEAYCGWVPFPASERMIGYTDGAWSTLVNWDKQVKGHHPTAIVIANADGTRAMGMALLEWPSLPSWPLDSYPMFGAGQVNTVLKWRKWNVTHPLTAKPLDAGNYVWKMRLFFGTMTSVKAQAQAIAFPKMSNDPMRAPKTPHALRPLAAAATAATAATAAAQSRSTVAASTPVKPWAPVYQSINATTSCIRPTLPTVCIGSASSTVLQSMSDTPDRWKTVRASCGMYVHPVGFVPLYKRDKNAARNLANAFANKNFAYELSIGSMYRGGVNAVPLLQYHDMVKDVSPTSTCAGIFLYVTLDMMNDMPTLVSMFTTYVKPAKDACIPVYMLITPPAAIKEPSLMKTLMHDRIRGQPSFVWLAKTVGAVGIGIDYPTGHWIAPNRAKWNPESFRELAIYLGTQTQAAGLRFVWVLNGNPYGPGDIQRHVREVKDRGLVPDAWIVDHFNSLSLEAIPENDPTTVTGGAYAVLSAVHT